MFSGASGSASRPTQAVAIGAAVLAFMLAGCSDDTPSGGSTPTPTSTASTTSTTTMPPTTDSATPTPSTPDPAMVADCAAVKSVLDSVSTQFPDGPNLTVGQPPSETNVQALTAIRDGFTGLTLTWPAVMKRVEGSLKAINAILASPTAPLSQKVVDRFNSAGSKLADACVGAS